MSTIYVADNPGFAHDPLLLTAVNRVRGSVGLSGVESLTDQMLDTDRLLLLTSRAFELPSVRPPAQVRYVGPQLPDASSVDRVQVRLPAGDAPVLDDPTYQYAAQRMAAEFEPRALVVTEIEQAIAARRQLAC
jgi:hypothetical protein